MIDDLDLTPCARLVATFLDKGKAGSHTAAAEALQEVFGDVLNTDDAELRNATIRELALGLLGLSSALASTAGQLTNTDPGLLVLLAAEQLKLSAQAERHPGLFKEN